MDKKEIIEQLRKIRWIDKYHNFKNILPGIENTAEDQKEIIVNIVEDCCTDLIRVYNTQRRPTKLMIKKVILRYMDDISYAKVDELNRDFGYELCWYISEKVGINLRKSTDTKVYGYWQVVGEELKIVTKRGKRTQRMKSTA